MKQRIIVYKSNGRKGTKMVEAERIGPFAVHANPYDYANGRTWTITHRAIGLAIRDGLTSVSARRLARTLNESPKVWRCKTLREWNKDLDRRRSALRQLRAAEAAIEAGGK